MTFVARSWGLAGVSGGRGGWMKKALQGETERSFPKQAWGRKVRIGEWEKGVCEQTEPLFVACPSKNFPLFAV